MVRGEPSTSQPRAPKACVARRAKDAAPVTRILVTCPECGADGDVRPQHLVARSCIDADWHSYAFRCEACRSAVSIDTSADIVERLTRSGVRFVAWSLPAELTESRPCSPWTARDLRDFHAEVAQLTTLHGAA